MVSCLVCCQILKKKTCVCVRVRVRLCVNEYIISIFTMTRKITKKINAHSRSSYFTDSHITFLIHELHDSLSCLAIRVIFYISFLNCIFSFFSSLSVIFNCWASGYFYCSINHPVKMFFQIQMVCNTLQIHILVFFLIFRLFKKVCKRRIIITKINLAYSSGQAK